MPAIRSYRYSSFREQEMRRVPGESRCMHCSSRNLCTTSRQRRTGRCSHSLTASSALYSRDPCSSLHRSRFCEDLCVRRTSSRCAICAVPDPRFHDREHCSINAMLVPMVQAANMMCRTTSLVSTQKAFVGTTRSIRPQRRAAGELASSFHCLVLAAWHAQLRFSVLPADIPSSRRDARLPWRLADEP